MWDGAGGASRAGWERPGTGERRDGPGCAPAPALRPARGPRDRRRPGTSVPLPLPGDSALSSRTPTLSPTLMAHGHPQQGRPFSLSVEFP